MSYSMRNRALTPAGAAALIAEIRDPATGAERLAEIAHDWTPPSGWGAPQGPAATLLGPLAARADLPPAELALLLPVRPHEACRNPALPLAVLEAPHLFAAVTTEAKQAVLRVGHAPAPLVAVWASAAEPEAGVRYEARMHVALASEVGEGEDWRGMVFEHWREHAARADGERRQQYVELVELGLAPAWVAGPEPWPEPFAHHQYEGRRSRPRPPYVTEPAPTAEQAAAAAAALAEKALGIEASTGIPLPEDAARRLLRGSHASVRLALVRRPDCPGSLLAAVGVPDLEFARTLAAHPNAAAAAHGKAGVGLLAALAHHSNASVRRLTVRHRDFPPSELSSVREHALATARKHLATTPLPYFLRLTSPGTKPQELWNLMHHPAGNPGQPWRWRLAAAAALPPDDPLLGDLSRDGNRLVRAAAKARLGGEAFSWPDGWAGLP